MAKEWAWISTISTFGGTGTTYVDTDTPDTVLVQDSASYDRPQFHAIAHVLNPFPMMVMVGLD